MFRMGSGVFGFDLDCWRRTEAVCSFGLDFFGGEVFVIYYFFRPLAGFDTGLVKGCSDCVASE